MIIKDEVDHLQEIEEDEVVLVALAEIELQLVQVALVLTIDLMIVVEVVVVLVETELQEVLVLVEIVLVLETELLAVTMQDLHLVETVVETELQEVLVLVEIEVDQDLVVEIVDHHEIVVTLDDSLVDQLEEEIVHIATMIIKKQVLVQVIMVHQENKLIKCLFQEKNIIKIRKTLNLV